MKRIKMYLPILLLLTISNGVCSQVINSYQYDNVVNTGFNTIFKDGISKTYYIVNGLSVTTSANLYNEYGKYYQIHIEIENLTGNSILFNPNEIVALMTNFKTDKKTKVVSVDNQTKGHILTSEEFNKKVQRSQNMSSFLNGLGAYSDANSAGYSTSTTTTSVSGYSNTYGSVDNYYNNKYTGESVAVNASTYGTASGTSVTKSYNGQAAYQARKEAERETAKFDNELYQIRSELNQNYLKINTIEHRQRLKGSVNLKYEDVDRIELLIPVNGKYYSFVYNNHPQQNNSYQQQNTTTNSNTPISQSQIVLDLVTEASSHYNNKRFDDALISTNKALAIEPNNIYLLTQKATLYAFSLNNKTEAIKVLEKAIQVDSSGVNIYRNYILKAGIEFQLKEYSKMVEDANSAIKLQPNSIEGYNYRALAKSCLNENYDAIMDYEKIISISNKSFKQYDNLGLVYNNMGYSYIKLGDYEKAKPLIEKATDLLPNYSYVWGSKGELYYKLGDYKKCIEFMTTAIDLVEQGNDLGGTSSDPSIPYYYRALSKIKKGKQKDSCLDLSKAIKLGNKDAVVLFNENCK